MSYDIRAMTRDDLQRALAWAREEGWNPGLDDAAAFHAADPSGFLMGWLDGEPVSSISVVKYDARFAFLGLYIVREPCRGRGLGKAIWDAGIGSAGSRTIGLDGVVAQQENYRRSGFALAHRSARWSGTPTQLPATSPQVRPLEASDLDALMAYDRQVFPADRAAFVAAWAASGGQRSTNGHVAPDGTLEGYGTIRRCIEGWKIGPLLADTPRIAEALVAALVMQAGAASIAMDIPEPNVSATALAARIGLAPAFETARMYRGHAPTLPLMRVFGITTLELG